MTMLNNHRSTHKNSFLKLISALLCFAVIIITLILTVYNVPKTISAEDAIYIERILNESGAEPDKLIRSAQTDFNQEIEIIRQVQESSFTTAPKVQLIPKGTPREPKNLYLADAAYCTDRARYIDKALRYLGFETRYAALYLNTDKHGFIATLLRKSTAEDADSHALVEVMTQKGWMIVDTRRHWISLTEDSNVVSLNALKNQPTTNFIWDKGNKENAWPLLDRDYYIIYELYSRHGQFYPPYTKYIPDVNWKLFFKENLTTK